MPKQCYFCKGETQEQKVRVDFRWGEDLVIIEAVPATVCQQCGEQYFDAQVSRQMEKLAKAKLSAKRVVHVPVRHFAEAELIPVL